MRMPRDWSGDELIRRLRRFSYEPTRQTGSHVRLTRDSENEQHHITIPLHNPVKIGTLNSILGEVAGHLKMDRQELLRNLL